MGKIRHKAKGRLGWRHGDSTAPGWGIWSLFYKQYGALNLSGSEEWLEHNCLEKYFIGRIGLGG